MAKIEVVQACTVSVPLDDPIVFATRRVTAREYTLVHVRTDDGVVGLGVAYVSNEGGSLATTAVRDLIAPKLVGKDPLLVELHWDSLYQDLLLHGRAGSVMRALSAVDVALWDRNARAVGLPLWKYLGGAAEESVPAYASGGYHLSGKGVEGVADEAQSYVDAGFTAVKIKVGGVGLKEDVARVAAVREVIGEEGTLLLDANHAWASLTGALQAAEAFAPYGPLFLEEPFGPDDTRLHEAYSRSASVPLATGELMSGRWSFQRLLAADAVRYIQPDASGCGGITEFRRIAATAASFGVEVWPHWLHDIHVHLVASTPNSGMVEYFPDAHVLNFRWLIDHQLEVAAGRIRLPDRPGLGMDLVEERVEKYLVDPWG